MTELERLLSQDNCCLVSVASIKKALKQEPCNDCISRQATVERLCKVADFMNEKRNGLGSPYVMAALFIQDNKVEFPPVTPQQRTGHWIYQTSDDYLGELIRYYECSECGRTVGDTVGDIYTEYPYCHCGAKMVEPQESEE